MNTGIPLGRIELGLTNASPALTIPSTPYSIPTQAVLKANDTQVGGQHYKGKAIQPWDYIVANDMGYLAGNVVKYVTRYSDKAGLVDLKKALHYLEKLIEIEEAITLNKDTSGITNLRKAMQYLEKLIEVETAGGSK